MANRAKFEKKDFWIGRHRAFKQPIEGYYKFDIVQPKKEKRLAEYNRVTKELQGMIRQAVQEGKTLRAMGSSWSLSKVGITKDKLLNTKNLSLAFTIGARHISAQYNKDHKKLRFLQTGAEIVTINRYLFDQKLNLKASGSNDGQTLAGVISTGTHGSAFKFGSCQDFVVGLHLVTGPNKHVYLQRASAPVVKESFAKMIGAKLISDDVLFNAALVSFGSFGIIHGMMVETRDLFLLDASRKFRKFDSAVEKAIASLDFSGFKNLPRPASKLYHFQVTVNPNESVKGKRPKEVAVFFMWERKFQKDYEPTPWDQGEAGPGASGLELMGQLFEWTPGPLKKFVKKKLNEQVRKLYEYEVTGTFLDLFRGEKAQGKVYASGIAIELQHALHVLDIALQTYDKFGTVMPILMSLRFVKGSKALLGFTKFKNSCVLEIDGINTPKTHEYADEVWRKVEEAGIPFTMHWGKFNTFLTPERVQNMYGEQAKQWVKSRETLLSPEVRKVFTNQFLKSIGLAS